MSAPIPKFSDDDVKLLFAAVKAADKSPSPAYLAKVLGIEKTNTARMRPSRLLERLEKEFGPLPSADTTTEEKPVAAKKGGKKRKKDDVAADATAAAEEEAEDGKVKGKKAKKE